MAASDAVIARRELQHERAARCRSLTVTETPCSWLTLTRRWTPSGCAFTRGVTVSIVLEQLISLGGGGLYVVAAAAATRKHDQNQCARSEPQASTPSAPRAVELVERRADLAAGPTKIGVSRSV